MQEKPECIVFDLDGTLISSHTTIYKATLAALKKLEVTHDIREEEFNKLIGLHFLDIFKKFNIDSPDFEYFINVYKNCYFDYINSSIIYEGVEELLDGLKKEGYRTALLTTKGQDQAEKIIKHFGLASYFDHIMGRRPGIKLKPDPDPLLRISEELAVQPEKMMMVGDTEMDVLCGKNAGAKTCAVSYGYRSEKELRELDPDYIIEEARELMNILQITV